MREQRTGIGRIVLVVVGVWLAVFVLAFLAQKAMADTTCNSEGQCITATLVQKQVVTAIDEQQLAPVIGAGISSLDPDEQASASGHDCGKTYKARWITRVKGIAGALLATINWRQGYCITPYPHYGLTWVGRLKPIVSVNFWGENFGFEYRGVTWSKDGYFDSGFSHSSIKWLKFTFCVGHPTGKLCHDDRNIGRRMVVDGFGNNHLYAL